MNNRIEPITITKDLIDIAKNLDRNVCQFINELKKKDNGN